MKLKPHIPSGIRRAARTLLALCMAACPLLAAGADPETDGPSAPGLFNSGNSRLREGQIGEAILSYERASLLAPQDADIGANLKLARSRAGLWNGEASALDRFLHRFALHAWATIGASALFLFVASLPLALLAPRSRILWIGLRVAAAPVLAVSLGVLFLGWPDLDRAVTTAKEAAARVAPAPAAGVIFHLREGETVHLVRSRGDFLLVCDRDGRRGWVKAGEVIPVIPGRKGS